MATSAQREKSPPQDRFQRISGLLLDLPIYATRSQGQTMEGCIAPENNCEKLYDMNEKIQAHLTAHPELTDVPALFGSPITYLGWNKPSGTALDILDRPEKGPNIPVTIADVYGVVRKVTNGNIDRPDCTLSVSDSLTGVLFSTSGTGSFVLGKPTPFDSLKDTEVHVARVRNNSLIALPKGDTRPELYEITRKAFGLFAGLNLIVEHTREHIFTLDHPQQIYQQTNKIAEEYYIPTLQKFIEAMNELMNTASVRNNRGIVSALSPEDQVSMRLVNSLLVAEAYQMFPWTKVQEEVPLDIDLIEKIDRISQTPQPEWGHYLNVAECEQIAQQNIHLGRTFSEQLYQGVRQRIGARYSDAEGVPRHAVSMPLVIEMGENGLAGDPQSIYEANCLIWSSLNDVCAELGISFEKSMYWNYHPDVDNGLKIVDSQNRVYGGETVIAHEVRHLTEPANQGKRFIVLDFHLQGKDRLSWSTATAVSEGPQMHGNTVSCFLAPLYPSQSDIQYALQMNANYAMGILRQKPYYFLLSQQQKAFVEQNYRTKPGAVGSILNLAQDELMGLNDSDYLEPDVIQFRTYPWKEDLWDLSQIKTPLPSIKTGAGISEVLDGRRSIRKSRDRK